MNKYKNGMFYEVRTCQSIGLRFKLLLISAFFIMIVISLDRIAKHSKGVPKPADVKTFTFDKIPDFIGKLLAILNFMKFFVTLTSNWRQAGLSDLLKFNLLLELFWYEFSVISVKLTYREVRGFGFAEDELRYIYMIV